MKKLLQTLFFFLLFLITAFPQDRIHRGVIPEKLTAERLLEIHKPNAGVLQGLNDRESLLLKSKSSNWQTALRNPQRAFYEEEGFNTKDIRTTINKTLLGNGYLLIEDIYQFWGGSAWVNYWKQSYTYDGNNYRIEGLYQTWEGSAWVNAYKYSYTYDVNNNQTEELYQNWDGSTWVNDFKRSYTYDVNNNLTEELGQDWEGSAWVNSYKVSYTYDGNNNLTEILGQDWYGSVWVNMYKYIFSYIPTGIEQFEGEVSSYSLSNNYPNPFNPSTSIQYAIGSMQFISLKVYDVLGDEVATLVNEEKTAGSYEVNFNASHLSSGIYFYKLQAGSFVETKKMILIK